MKPSDQLHVCVVGSGTRFLSGISVYTVRLANALARTNRVSVIAMRQLLPTRLYPGRLRVGADLSRLERRDDVDLLDGVDWYWFPSMLRAAAFVMIRRPDIVIFEWWTGTVLHSYVALALLARLLRARVVIEFHELLDTGEARIPVARIYVRTVLPLLLRLAGAYAVHSAFDKGRLEADPELPRRPILVLPHGPHDHYQAPEQVAAPAIREAPESVCNLLFFGVIRPYKGLENLVAAFDQVPEIEINDFWLTVVGESWESWSLPLERIARSNYRDRITLENRYVPDAELDQYLRGADVVVLPYRRSALSGPLHVAMGYGLPVVMTDVGGNAEAAAGYEGVILVPPGDERALVAAIRSARALKGRRFKHPHSWDDTAAAYDSFFRSWRASTAGTREWST